MAHGCESPLVTTLTRILCCSAVSKTQGPSPNGGTGTPIVDCPWAWPTASRPNSNSPAMRAERLTFIRISPGRSSWRSWRRSAVPHPWKSQRDDTSVGGWNPAILHSRFIDQTGVADSTGDPAGLPHDPDDTGLIATQHVPHHVLFPETRCCGPRRNRPRRRGGRPTGVYGGGGTWGAPLRQAP